MRTKMLTKAGAMISGVLLFASNKKESTGCVDKSRIKFISVGSSEELCIAPVQLLNNPVFIYSP